MSSQERLNELLLEELAPIVNREVGLANSLITVSYVDCSPDLKQAKVGISVLPDQLAGTALRQLKAATGAIVNILKKRLPLRRLPHFTWVFDASEKEASRISELITKANREE